MILSFLFGSLGFISLVFGLQLFLVAFFDRAKILTREALSNLFGSGILFALAYVSFANLP